MYRNSAWRCCRGVRWILMLCVAVCGMRITLGAPQAIQREGVSFQEALVQARYVTHDLSSGLQKLLGEELAKGGFAGAVKVCSERAQTVSGEFNAAVGASARRVSLRFRNPNGEPDPYEAAMLRRWQQLQGRKELPEESAEVVRERDGARHLRYMKPIVIQAMCLNCHGSPEQLPPEVKAVLGARYPRDLATGYAEGNLRGAVSVRIPLNGE
ncbi:MAG: DUF3365 domain-containing protein [Bryobacterales bacterium]|nr:DUF3365 domain-containing protein [Bryobacterales bacterium]